MARIVHELKSSLIHAAYPRGGGDFMKYSNVLGVSKENMVDSRANEQFTTFDSLLAKVKDDK
eukprot:CAMPEP_0170509310 /NCGR_PEP_ID=MMETSP0208-20121228/65087_1 /TAXON_ID=197538 /ORGANISM="Strombidium inclinatum, Strain S3" /LENGTH=61 /DNA_ID=CAMNT_0010792651 /DNA_START=1 /DNA_END=186 /DNA_ORIENTATION=-